MKSITQFIQFVAQFITLGLALAFVVTLFAPDWATRLRGAVQPAPATVATGPGFGPLAATPAELAARERENPSSAASQPYENPTLALERERAADTIMSSYSRAVQRAAPAVVSIFADRMASTQRMLVPTDPQLRQMIAPIPVGAPYQRTVQNLGSGVIVGSDGYVLTNNHVINGAEKIYAKLNDGRTTTAKLVGSDPETDLAVLKLDISELPILAVSARAPAAGDVVLAIGSPFGLGNTVTMGIVSAIGRQVAPGSYEDFIQTDAAINEGNSGGALVNAFGELVGINSRTYSPSGGNVGISFAIPVSTAKNVLDQIIDQGRVIRGWMGATYENLPPAPDTALPALPRGVTIMAVATDGPAAKAGIKQGDLLIGFNGKPVINQFDLHNRESHVAPGNKVHVAVMREGKLLQLDIVLVEQPPLQTAQTNP